MALASYSYVYPQFHITLDFNRIPYVCRPTSFSNLFLLALTLVQVSLTANLVLLVLASVHQPV
jgi:hypothetical protein